MRRYAPLHPPIPLFGQPARKSERRRRNPQAPGGAAGVALQSPSERGWDGVRTKGSRQLLLDEAIRASLSARCRPATSATAATTTDTLAASQLRPWRHGLRRPGRLVLGAAWRHQSARRRRAAVIRRALDLPRPLVACGLRRWGFGGGAQRVEIEVRAGRSHRQGAYEPRRHRPHHRHSSTPCLQPCPAVTAGQAAGLTPEAASSRAVSFSSPCQYTVNPDHSVRISEGS